MAKITFKTKAGKLHDGDIIVDEFKVPALTRSHCDMDKFRSHPKYGDYANSDLFPGILARIAKEVAPSGWIRSDRLPSNVTVTPGYLTTITIEV